MAGDDIRRYSLDEINELRRSGKATGTPDDAPEIELDEAFWCNARLVETTPRKTSVHLRIEPETLAFFRAGGPGHLTRMARVLKAYARSRATAKG